MYNAQTLKKRLDIILSRENARRNSSSAKTRNLGMPKSNYSRKLQTSHQRTISSSDKDGARVSEVKLNGKCAKESGEQPRKIENNTGNMFMYKRKQINNRDSHIDGRMNFKRLSVTDTLQISSFKEEDYRGRVILTSNENLIQEQHFLPGFKFADVNLRLNSTAINKPRLKEAFKTKDYGVSAKKVIEIRIPSINGPISGYRNVARNKKPYFLYRHQNTPNMFR